MRQQSNPVKRTRYEMVMAWKQLSYDHDYVTLRNKRIKAWLGYSTEEYALWHKCASTDE